MKVVKRLYLSVFGTLDAVVDRLQNHDALVQASLAELDEKLVEARSSYSSLNRTLKRTVEEAESARKESETWRVRARDRGLANQKESALECLRRAQQADATAAALDRQAKSSEISRRKVEETIEEMQNVQKTLTLKHRELRARAQGNALTSISPFSNIKDAEEMLGRWEDTLGGEVESLPVDDFAAGFVNEESRVRLEQELEALMRGA